MEKIICAVCGAKEARKVKRPYEATYGRQVEVKIDNVEIEECEACGEQVLTPEQARYISQSVKKIAREKLDLLAPEKIVSIRREYGLSQEELERLLGLGEKVVTRWERGKVLQAKTADVVLRLMDAFPSVVQYLRRMRYQGEPDLREVQLEPTKARDLLERIYGSNLTPSKKDDAIMRIEFMETPSDSAPNSGPSVEQPEPANFFAFSEETQ